MSLPSPSLDDRTFQELVDEAKRRIPDLVPEWTDHNVSDPGVAMIELFAWMTESLIYRLNQVPDRLYVRFLELMGITLYPPAAAETELTFRLSAPQNEPVLVPGGTEVGTLQTIDSPAIVFHTAQPVMITPPRLVAALTGSGGRASSYIDRWDDLRFDRQGVDCFMSLQVGDAMYFGFEDSLRRNIVRLNIHATTEGVGVRPDDPPISWEVSTNDQWMPVEILSDGTGGLNRSGVIEMQIPPQHDALTLSSFRAYWIRVRLLEERPGQPGYRRSPEIRSMTPASLGGSVAALHGERVSGEVLGNSDGRPAQTFTVQHAPVLPRRPGQTLVLRLPDGTDEPWTEVEDFGLSGPEDRHFTWDSSSGEIRFGPYIRQPDGSGRQLGAVPPERAEVRITRYVHGGGAHGNVRANQLTVLRSTIPFVDTVTNRRPATGGVDGETLEQARMRGPAAIRSGQRAVTATDFELLAHEASRQVARARALSPERPGDPVRLLIVPAAYAPSGQTLLDHLHVADDLFDAVAAHIDQHRLLGISVEIGPPRYRGVSVVAQIEVQAGRDPEVTRQRAAEAISQDIDPLSGGPDGRGWPWDRGLGVAHVYALLSAVEGVARVQDVLLFEADPVTGERDTQGMQQLPLEPDALWFPVRHVVL